MSRAKVQRKSTAIDMTAMCDVAFLLLTFFILSAKPKTEDPVRAEVPASIAKETIPETDFAIITVGEGKVFYTIEGDDVRKETIKAMGDQYKIAFTPEQINTFAHTESFGVALNVLPQFLSLTGPEKTDFKQTGMPVDTTEHNDLANWVLATRKANVLLHNKEPQIAIKGDSKEEYPTIAKIIKTLQKQKVNKFSLITSLRTVTK
ncbi:biopolymer transporter ExbD [Mucilaginibacter sp.]|uniref:biopolymer transporter ExbD n=1 Tax=Mucilaginibacter sp. TaxID=1882438 RepID=UPI00262DADB7|nr:biopolymer transporter ExbD [Mucilaginibacter sp.]MDB5031032.1 biopolymer transporter ExbD [Mucilaginibacter sp.]